jgi:hypothetical protein
LGFKEDFVEPETIKAIVDEFEKYAFSAYKKEEYSFYAEAHIPRIKSYVNKKDGTLIERKPHVHIVIPEINLVSGKRLQPFGLVKSNLAYIDAFQEHINHKYGLSSPKDNRRVEFNSSSEIISRHVGDVFTKGNHDVKENILVAILSKDIKTQAELSAYLEQVGEVRIRNNGAKNQYLNVKPAGNQKGINLKEFVFTDEFLKLDKSAKTEKLAELREIAYESARSAKQTPSSLLRVMDEWTVIKSREVKYVNSGDKVFFKLYKSLEPEAKLDVLKERESKFYLLHENGGQHERIGKSRGNGTGRRSNQRNRDEARGAQATPSIGDLPDLHKLNMVHDTERSEMLLPRNARNNVEYGESSRDNGLRRSERGRKLLKTNPVEQSLDALQEKTSGAKSNELVEFRSIRKNLDAERLLISLSKSHGLMIEKYSIHKGKDGSDRILAGKHHHNVSDFLTKEMNLPWVEASTLLRKVYAEQVEERSKGQVTKGFDGKLWSDFIAHEKVERQRNKEKMIELKHAEKERLGVVVREMDLKKSALNATVLNAADRREKSALASMEKAAKVAEIRKEFNIERQIILTLERAKIDDRFRFYLVNKAAAGDVDAIKELRRIRAIEPKRYDDEVAINSIERVNKTIIYSAKSMNYRVNKHGDLEYHHDGDLVMRDSGDAVFLSKLNSSSIEIALRLAVEKHGNTLNVTGSQKNKEHVAKVASKLNLSIKFNDDELNKVMQNERTSGAGVSRRNDEIER